ncbi:MAG: hypothetical protein GQ569_13815 [Methylococcaceae bacterium]|nr:hypothetical protein [Methylococcaceae bacterium]
MQSIKLSELKQFTSKPKWYAAQGMAMIIFGGIIASLSILAPNVTMLGKNFSWLPIIGIIVLLVGCSRCIDAYASDSAQGFLYNMQGGILDVVVGFLVIFSLDKEPDNLILLLVGYLVSQGIYRNVLLSVAQIRNPMSNRITGLISIILGMFIWIWVDGSTSGAWFLSLSLSVDICFRGWALIVLASSLKTTAVKD